MKQAISAICLIMAGLIVAVVSLCYGEDFKKSIEPIKIAIEGVVVQGDKAEINSDEIKIVCIKFRGKTRCTDTSLLWYLMPAEGEMVTR